MSLYARAEYKDNHIPAPGLSFTEPNLPFLIREVEGLVQAGG